MLIVSYVGLELAVELRCRSAGWRGIECITSWKCTLAAAACMMAPCGYSQHMHRHDI